MRRVLIGIVIALSVVACQATPTSVATSAPSTAAPTDSAAAVVTTPSPTASPAPSPAATPSPTPEPTATPSPTPKPIAACRAAQLRARVTGWSGAMGSQIADVTLTNTSSTSCTVQGTPEVELVGANGVILIDSRTAGASGLPHVSPGDHAFVLAHGGVVRTEVQVANYCGSTPVLPTTIAFVLPSGAGRIVAAPGPGGGVPGCMSSPGSPGDIGMNGWTT